MGIRSADRESGCRERGRKPTSDEGESVEGNLCGKGAIAGICLVLAVILSACAGRGTRAEEGSKKQLEQRRVLKGYWSGSSRTPSVAFSPDGRLIATLQTLQKWPAGFEVRIDVREVRSGKVVFQKTDGNGVLVEFSADGKVLSTGIAAFEVGTWRPAVAMKERYAGQGVVFLSPDGKRWAEVERSAGKVVLHGKGGEDVVGVIRADISSASMYLAFSEDGSLLAVAELHRVILMDTHTGKTRDLAMPDSESVRAVMLSPKGRRMLTLTEGVGKGPWWRVWDVREGKAVGILSGFPAPEVASFSPDGRTIATGGFDRRVELWDGATGKKLFSRVGPGHMQKPVTAIAWSADGKMLATAAIGEGTVILWDVTLEANGPEPTSQSQHLGEGTEVRGQHTE